MVRIHHPRQEGNSRRHIRSIDVKPRVDPGELIQKCCICRVGIKETIRPRGFRTQEDHCLIGNTAIRVIVIEIFDDEPYVCAIAVFIYVKPAAVPLIRAVANKLSDVERWTRTPTRDLYVNHQEHPIRLQHA